MFGRLLGSSYRACSKLVVRQQHCQAAVSSCVQISVLPTSVNPIALKTQNLGHAKFTVDLNKKEYILPSLRPNSVTILDPKPYVATYQLPTYVTVTQDKLSPPWKKIVPIEDPKRTDIADQILMPLMVRIRKRKMKRHKYKKMRKRLQFMFRRLDEAKRKKKLKAMRLYVSKWDKLANEFDAEKLATERLNQARAMNWSVDPLREWKKGKSSTPAAN